MNKSKPVLIVFSILAGLQVLSGAAVIGDVLGAQVFGVLVIGIAAVQVGMTFYVQNQVVPGTDVAAFVNGRGEVVAGPAAGVTNGMAVEIAGVVPPAPPVTPPATA